MKYKYGQNYFKFFAGCFLLFACSQRVTTDVGTVTPAGNGLSIDRPINNSYTNSDTIKIEGSCETGKGKVRLTGDFAESGVLVDCVNGRFEYEPATLNNQNGSNDITATQSPNSDTITVHHDNIAPQVTIEPNGVTLNNPNVKLTGTCEYFSSGSPKVIITGAIAQPTPPAEVTCAQNGTYELDVVLANTNGPNNLRATQQDPAGNESAADAVITVTDGSSGALSIDSPMQGSPVYDNQIQVSGFCAVGGGNVSLSGNITSASVACDSNGRYQTNVTLGSPNANGLYDIFASQRDQASVQRNAQTNVYRVEWAAFCGDGIQNQAWEQCDSCLQFDDNDETCLTPNPNCNEYCQNPNSNICRDLMLAQLQVDSYNNFELVNGAYEEYSGQGNNTRRIHLGTCQNPVPAGTWFALYHNGNYIVDAPLDQYENSRGLSVQRLQNQVNVQLYAGHNAQNYEQVGGKLRFYNATLDQVSTDSRSGYQLENWQNNETCVDVGQSVCADNDLLRKVGNEVEFWMADNVGHDAFTSTYQIDNLCCQNQAKVLTNAQFGVRSQNLASYLRPPTSCSNLTDTVNDGWLNSFRVCTQNNSGSVYQHYDFSQESYIFVKPDLSAIDVAKASSRVKDIVVSYRYKLQGAAKTAKVGIHLPNANKTIVKNVTLTATSSMLQKTVTILRTELIDSSTGQPYDLTGMEVIFQGYSR